MDGRARNQDPGPVSGIRYNMRGQPSETGLLNVGMRRTWGVPSGLPSEVRKVGLSTPRPFNPPSRTAIRLVVLIANGTSDFASERSDAKSYVRNRQDGPDIRNVGFHGLHGPPVLSTITECSWGASFPAGQTLTAPEIPFILLNGCRAARPARGWRDFLFLT